MKRTTLAGLFIILALSFIFTGTAGAETNPLVGEWKGILEIPGSPFDIITQFNEDTGTLNGTIQIIQQNSTITLVNIAQDGANVTFALDGVPGDPTFKGVLADDSQSIAGDFTQGDQTLKFSLAKADNEKALEGAEDKLAQISAFIESSLKSWNVPGLSIAIVKDGETVMAQGFGLRDVEKQLPVTENTLMAIGSTTKAMTCACLEMLVEEGLIDWNELVKSYLPTFKLKDEYITNHLTVRDIVTHRSGMARHDFAWLGSPFSRYELFDRMQYFDVSAEMRTKFQYNNFMYMTAGILIEEVSGMKWEEFISARLHKPLGMNDINYTTDDMTAANEAALPYNIKDNKAVLIPYRNIDHMASAGSVNASASDMAKWLTFNLNKGKAGDAQLLSPGSIGDMQIVHFPTMNPNMTSGDFVPLGYGLGWNVKYYQNHYCLEHGGGIDGFSASVNLMPNDNIAVYATSNAQSQLPTVIGNYVMDVMLDKDPIDWTSRYKGQRPSYASGTEDKKESKPTHELKAYAGKYEHPGYGLISITIENDALNYAYNGVNEQLKHDNFDNFDFVDDDIPSPYNPSFRTGTDGSIQSIVANMEATVDPIIFTKLPTVNEYIVNYSDKPIKLDGKLSEKDWKKAASTDDFVIHQNGAKATYSTMAQMLRDDANLYIAFTVEDKDVWSTFENHDDRLWTEEAVEMMIDPDGDGRNYLELQVNSLGTTLDLKMNRQYSQGGSPDFDYTLDGFEAAVSVKGKINNEKGKDKGWTCEIKIPFASFQASAPDMTFPPSDGDSWRMNLCRIENIRGENKSQEAVAWNRTDGRGFHAPDKMGRIIFGQ